MAVESVGDTGGDLAGRISGIARETRTLIRQETELARAELALKLESAKLHLEQSRRQAESEMAAVRSELEVAGRVAARGGGLLGAAGLAGVGAFAALTVALIAGLAVWMPAWTAALVVAFVYAGLSGALAVAGRAQIRLASGRLPAAHERARHAGRSLAAAGEWIRTEIPRAPERTIRSLKDSRDELVQAWRRGSNSKGGSR